MLVVDITVVIKFVNLVLSKFGRGWNVMSLNPELYFFRRCDRIYFQKKKCPFKKMFLSVLVSKCLYKVLKRIGYKKRVLSRNLLVTFLGKG